MKLNKIEKSKNTAKVLVTSIVIPVIVILVGIMGMSILARSKTPPAEVKNGERPLKVEALQVEQKDIPVFMTGYGEVKALNVVSIASEVSGIIVKIHPRLEIGEIIPKGELLFRIVPKDYLTIRKIGKKRLKIFKRSHELAKKEYDRVRILFEKNNVGARVGVEAAEKSMLSVADQINQMLQVLETAETNLVRCEVSSPFNARIKSVLLEKGQYVTPGQNVITLADDSLLEIQVPIDSRDARKWLRFREDDPNGKAAWFSSLEQAPCRISWTENNDGQTWDGRLHRVVKFNRQTRTLTVAVRVDAETEKKRNPLSLPLAEGMFCSVKIPGRTLKRVFELPRQAVGFDNTVYIAVGNRLKTVPVKIARVEGDNTYVAGGLNTGDMVVTTRLIDPLENSLLQITNKKEAES